MEGRGVDRADDGRHRHGGREPPAASPPRRAAAPGRSAEWSDPGDLGSEQPVWVRAGALGGAEERRLMASRERERISSRLPWLLEESVMIKLVDEHGGAEHMERYHAAMRQIGPTLGFAPDEIEARI